MKYRPNKTYSLLTEKYKNCLSGNKTERKGKFNDM